MACDASIHQATKAINTPAARASAILFPAEPKLKPPSLDQREVEDQQSVELQRIPRIRARAQTADEIQRCFAQWDQ